MTISTSPISCAGDPASLRDRVSVPAAAVAFSSREPGAGNVSLVVGDGDPLAARVGLLAAVGCALDDGVAMQQVHGGEVAVVGPAEAGRGMRDHADAIGGVDALVTAAPGVALMVMAADCVPLLLRGPGVVAAVHAGRGGVVSGVVAAAVAAMDAPPAGVEALIGPAIGGCCYEVPAAMAADVDRLVPGAAGRTRWGTPSLDLPAVVRAQLRAAGVGQVRGTGACTHCHPDRWFSHRAAPGAGRHAGVVVLRPPAAGGAHRFADHSVPAS